MRKVLLFTLLYEHSKRELLLSCKCFAIWSWAREQPTDLAYDKLLNKAKATRLQWLINIMIRKLA